MTGLAATTFVTGGDGFIGTALVKVLTLRGHRVFALAACGLPIITAMPGLVYGNGSWFRRRIIDPIRAGRRVIQFGRSDHWVSPIHLDDCAW
jgi:nucleoside-diphosphate-sugar epimerase